MESTKPHELYQQLSKGMDRMLAGRREERGTVPLHGVGWSFVLHTSTAAVTNEWCVL